MISLVSGGCRCLGMATIRCTFSCTIAIDCRTLPIDSTPRPAAVLGADAPPPSPRLLTTSSLFSLPSRRNCSHCLHDETVLTVFTSKLFSLSSRRQCSHCLHVNTVLTVFKQTLFSLYSRRHCSHCLHVDTVLTVFTLTLFSLSSRHHCSHCLHVDTVLTVFTSS